MGGGAGRWTVLGTAGHWTVPGTFVMTDSVGRERHGHNAPEVAAREP